jgi:hypothetical protein
MLKTEPKNAGPTHLYSVRPTSVIKKVLLKTCPVVDFTKKTFPPKFADNPHFGQEMLSSRDTILGPNQLCL